MKRQRSKYTLGGGQEDRSVPLVSKFIGHYFLSVSLKRPPRPRDFLGTETRAKWSMESDDSVNEGREATTVGSGLKESSKNNLLPSSSGSTFMAGLVAGPRGTIFKGGGAGFLCFLGTLRLWLLRHLADPDVELPPTTNRVTRPGLRG